MIELLHAPKQSRTFASSSATDISIQPALNEDPYRSQRIAYRLSQADQNLRDLYDAVRQTLLALGDDVQVKEVKNYVAFKRLKNFACVEVYPQNEVVIAYLKVDPKTIELEDGFSRDVSHIGHFGTGNLEIQLRSPSDIIRAHPFFLKSYEAS